MRTEQDFLGKVSIPADALYGIHSVRARENFPNDQPFPPEWYRACGLVKLAAYRTLAHYREEMESKHPEKLNLLHLPSGEVLQFLTSAAAEVSEGKEMEHFIVPAIQGGAGTSIHLNINEIICNLALRSMGRKPGDYGHIDPIESANVYQSTNDVIPTALTVAVMKLLQELEAAINRSRGRLEGLENRYRSSLRLAHTQMQEALPSTFGQLFSSYNDALSRDWWRVSKALERIKVVNLGGGATGSGLSIPRYYLMKVVPELKKITGLPLTQGENLEDATSNMDRWVEVHAILKAHAVNLEKMASDLRLLSADAGIGDISIPPRQTGSSIMPGKVNPVIPEYLLSASQKMYANDQLISSLSARGDLELNAYLPQVGLAMIESLKLLISMNHSLEAHVLQGLTVHEEKASLRLFRSPAVCTALIPRTGYHSATRLAQHMKEKNCDVFQANDALKLVDAADLKKWMEAGRLLKKGFTVKDLGKE